MEETASKMPNNVRLFRITHKNNLAHILQFGICNKSHTDANPDYVPIGNYNVIGRRTEHIVDIAGYGNVGDYVPFYFTPLSVMLYNILTGYGVPKIAPEEIIFLVSSVKTVANCGNRYFFTDGQANTFITTHFSHLKDLDQTDWDVVLSEYFKKAILTPIDCAGIRLNF